MSPSGGFRHVQHIRPNRCPTKRGPPQKERQIFECRKNWRTPSKTRVMSKNRSPVFFQKKIGSAAPVKGPHIFFLNRALMRVNPALPAADKPRCRVGKLWQNISGRQIVHQTLSVQKTTSIEIFTRYPSTTRMSAVMTLGVGKMAKTSINF